MRDVGVEMGGTEEMRNVGEMGMRYMEELSGEGRRRCRGIGV